MSTLTVRAERVVLPDGIRAAAVHVQNGRIVAVDDYNSRTSGATVVDAGPLVVMPGIVDTHVHLNDPGRADWEGFESGTRAAAAGGVTTVVDMPLNSVPSTTAVDALEAKLAAASGRCHVDVGFWGGVVPGNAPSLAPLVSRGVLGFKCFLSPSGVAEFEHVVERDLREALPALAQLRVPLLVHAELPARLAAVDPNGDARRYSTWLDSRPCDAEHSAIDLMVRLSHEYGAALHIVHLASADALPMFQGVRGGATPVTVETCPHYLTFAAEEIPDGATAHKCAPPIRSGDHRERLWRGLIDGTIDLVATDHSPAPPAMKRTDDGDFTAAWGGIASLQLGLSIVWTGAASRGVSLDRVSAWMSAAPADLAGLTAKKGRIAVGADADLVFFEPGARFTVDPAALHHRHPLTPYAGMELRGRVHKTFLRGEPVYDNGRFADAPLGRAILGRC